jgi:hypothetical protein
MPRKLPDTQQRLLLEMGKGTELRRVQAYPGARVKYFLGDKVTDAGPVAGLAMSGLIRPIDKVELSAPLIRYGITESGRLALAQAAA